MRRRQSERGAALFVVVLVVTLLTAIGVFAMHATSLAQLGSGYSRRAATAFYLAELMTNFRIATIADNPTPYVQHGNGIQPGQAQRDVCFTAKNADKLAPELPFCVAWLKKAASDTAIGLNSSIGSDPEGFLGALNRPDSPDPVLGVVRAESTDHATATMPLMPGWDGKARIWQDTLSVTGSLMPTPQVGDTCSTDVTRASETEMLRASIIYVEVTNQ